MYRNITVKQHSKKLIGSIIRYTKTVVYIGVRRHIITRAVFVNNREGVRARKRFVINIEIRIIFKLHAAKYDCYRFVKIKY